MTGSCLPSLEVVSFRGTVPPERSPHRTDQGSREVPSPPPTFSPLLLLRRCVEIEFQLDEFEVTARSELTGDRDPRCTGAPFDRAASQHCGDERRAFQSSPPSDPTMATQGVRAPSPWDALSNAPRDRWQAQAAASCPWRSSWPGPGRKTYADRNINASEAGYLIPLVSFPQGPRDERVSRHVDSPSCQSPGSSVRRSRFAAVTRRRRWARRPTGRPSSRRVPGVLAICPSGTLLQDRR